MSEPRIGMSYNEARKKAKHFAGLSNVKDERGRERIISSIVNQARLGDGEEAARDIVKEIGDSARSFSGIGNRQIGWGDGYKVGDGHWKWVDGKWIEKR